MKCPLPLLFVAMAVLSQPAFAQQSGTTKVAPPVDAEVTVSAIRRLAELRKEMLAAEDRFIAKYNELNKEREYAITCNDEAHTGSRFLRRVCRPEFVSNATGYEARQWFRGSYSPPAPVIIESKTAGFRQNLLDLASHDAELRWLAVVHDDLKKRYDELLSRTVGAGSPNE